MQIPILMPAGIAVILAGIVFLRISTVFLRLNWECTHRILFWAGVAMFVVGMIVANVGYFQLPAEQRPWWPD